MDFDQFIELDEVKVLLERGTERGTLTQGEIAEALDELEVSTDYSDELYAFLEEREIEVTERADTKGAAPEAVSYTHLTLPTICSV